MKTRLGRSILTAKDTFGPLCVFADVDQAHASTDFRRDERAVTIAAPHEWDGIGQALRAAYRDYRDAPCDISEILHRLDSLE